MAEEVREKLLEPFERGDVSYSGRIEGNGLGMALVKNIIDIMQGEIYVDSTIGEGTTIRTILHLKKSVEVEKQDDKAKKIFDPTGMLQGKRILLAEDGQEAVDKFKQSPEGYYTFILMDIRMPKLDGYEATKRIRDTDRTDKDIPIIALTANAFSDDVHKAQDAGMNAHIAKPIDVDKMIEVLASLSESKQMRL